jgi:gluconolactonase
MRPEFEDLIDVYAPVGQVGTGFTFTEGPIWHPVEQFLLFSDMPADVRRRWDQRNGVREVRRPSNKCNGMTYDAELNLVVCEHATSSLVRERPGGAREVLASHFEGQELNSPNDVCVRSDGSIYFSDPWYGRMPVYGVERPRQLGFQGVYRVVPGRSEPQLLVDRYLFDQPNGLCFCPTEERLYVNDTVQALIRVFDVRPDGTLADGFEAQAAVAFDNLLAVVAEAGMAASDLVKVTAFATEPGQVAVFRAVRDRKLGGHAPAATYLEVAGLARPDYLVEIEAEAVKEP